MRGSEKIVEIREVSREFFAHNLLYNLEAVSAMIPVGKNRFALRGHDVELQFCCSNQENQNKLNITSSWLKIDGEHFEKIENTINS
jgi:hypothetical protein